ncbi:MAG TPA: amino acid adenylation domain-containing protein, partial [Coleofasciculaceae cyanobacterium]
AERHQLLVEWNGTQTNYSQERCIHELFEAQVEHSPDAIAVVFEDEYLSYRELNQRANKIAHHLQKLGVKPEVLVGICVERSIEMVVGILGILKAGGAYLPLDPAYPKARLAFILEDAQIPLLLTQERLREWLPENKTQVVCLDADWQVIDRESPENLVNSATPENLVYVIYTSGSTGQPKGVMIQHESLVNYTQTASVEYAISSSDRILQFASISFDAAAEEIFPCLTQGATLVLRTDSMLNSVPTFLQQCRERSITVLDLPTAFWHQLTVELCEKQLQLPDQLRLVIIGGERALPERLATWQKHIGKRVQLVNSYGPTEATIVATTSNLSKMAEVDAQLREVPIGHAIPNVQVYVLNPYLQPTPIGVPGELYIGGVGVARGYLNRPELTAEKFIPNPFQKSRGAAEQGSSGGKEDSSLNPERLYKSGDLARYLPNGEIEYLGRIDDQVKIRGFRIELGEIETVLGQYSGVRETVVLVREDRPGDKQLVAYIVPNSEQVPTSSELRNYLKGQMPEYMVPSAFVMLEALPLTPNGKVDRRSLPAPDTLRPELDEAFVAPRTPVEELLTGIWSQVLNLERVGIHDNFFHLGGHSLLATQVMSRLYKTFQIELPLRCLFESPTIAELGEHIETAIKAGSGLPVPPLEPVSRDKALPLSFSQQRLWLLNQLEPNSPLYNVHAAVRLTGLLNVTALEQSFNEMVRRHEVLRTRFVTVDGQPFQVVEPALTLTLPVVDLHSLPPTERETKVQYLAQEEANRPFNLAECPLLRCLLLQLDDTEYVLLLTMHHIISDAWSVGVLIQEIGELYKAFSAKKVSPLTELPIQYADFAIWQKQWLQGEMLKTQLTYWKQQLDGAPPLLQLPTDRSRPTVRTFQGATRSLILPKPLTEDIKNLCDREGVTLFMTLLAAFKTLLYCWSGQDDIIVGSPIANRTRSELEGLIGFFTNTLVLRTDLSDNPSFRELLGRVRDRTLEAYTHQDLPFEKLIEELQPERNPSYNPLFQVWFVLQNTPTQSLELPDLNIAALNIDSDRAKHDLRLELEETEEGLKGSIGYRVDLFNPETITRIAEHFEILLRQITTQPNIKISSLAEILAEANKQQQLIQEKELEKASRQKFKMTKRKSISSV